MTKRILSSITLWSLLGAVLWFGGTTCAVLLVGVLSLLTLREFYLIQTAAGQAPFSKLGMFFGTLITVAPWLQDRLGWPEERLLPLAVLVFCIRVLGERSQEKRALSLASTLFGLVYVGLMLQFFVRILDPQPGDLVSPAGRLILCAWLVVVAKVCDTGALLTGLAIGRHPLAPQISPKKTWEGALGGIASSVIIGAIGAWLGSSQIAPCLTPARAALVAVPVATVAIVSDLIESILKRNAAIKDSGASIPGIGGVFDVSDSLLLAAPVGYFLLGLK
jgi:phosphatidate cytidylyltransferase